MSSQSRVVLISSPCLLLFHNQKLRRQHVIQTIVYFKANCPGQTLHRKLSKFRNILKCRQPWSNSKTRIVLSGFTTDFQRRVVVCLNVFFFGSVQHRTRGLAQYLRELQRTGSLCLKLHTNPEHPRSKTANMSTIWSIHQPNQNAYRKI